MTAFAGHGWIDRTGLGRPTSGEGAVICSPAGDVTVVVTPAQRAAAVQATASVLRQAGIGEGDISLLALAATGDGSGALLADACAAAGRASCHVEPRGRMRLIAAVQAVRPDVFVATPTGAADLLARLHMEFLVDPMELGLRLLIVTGELVADATLRHLASEFDVEVRQVWTEPVTGTALGWCSPGDGVVTVGEPGAVELGAVDDDRRLDATAELPPGEWVVHLGRYATVTAAGVRTGYVTAAGPPPPAGMLPVPSGTIGEHVLVRGRWLSLAALERALRPIDGIAGWQFVVSRPGTLDRADLQVGLDRPSLVDNPMWKGRIIEALRSVTPVTVTVTPRPAAEVPAGGHVVDERGQHLGRTRAALPA